MSKLTATVESPTLFPIQDLITPVFEPNKNSSTFLSNMRLPVHRWFRYSAGFSGDWAQKLITESSFERPTRVLDPFVGSGTTLIAAEMARVESCGLESHPFVFRVATAKLDWRSSAERYLNRLEQVKQKAKKNNPRD